MPLCLLLVIEGDAFDDTANIGIVKHALLRSVSVLCGKIAFLCAAFFAPVHAAPVANTNIETFADLWGSNSFHQFADRKRRPAAILCGWGPGQKLTDVLITDHRPVVFSAELPRFGRPGEQRFGIGLAAFLGAWQALHLIEKIERGERETSLSLRVLDPPFGRVLSMVAALTCKR